jgi:hypothetical protein
MKSSELRIGNLVINNLNGEILKPCDVLCDGINTDNIEGLNYAFIEPIQLTEEWLLNFGFKKHHITHIVYELNGTALAVKIWEDQFICFWGRTSTKSEIKHVHQLQNLYHSLTGEELISK